MIYIIIESPDGKDGQCMPLNSLSAISVVGGQLCFTMKGGMMPDEKRVTFGKYKTNSWSLYRMLKKCGMPVSFSII